MACATPPIRTAIKKDDTMHNKILTVNNLSVDFNTDDGVVQAVQDVSFYIDKGEVFSLVGESGSGKSVTARSLMCLNPYTASCCKNSDIVLHAPTADISVLKLKNERDRRCVRGKHISMIFQEPMASFAPAIAIGKQMVEKLMLHTDMKRPAAKKHAIDMLDRTGIPEPHKRFYQYAFELSGGMRQRAMIAMAISTYPELLIADEPTTALDVTIQAQVLELMLDLVKEFGMGILFITHDLGVVAETADRIAVMQQGKIVEQGDVKTVISKPTHTYTQRLLRAIPQLAHIVPHEVLRNHRRHRTQQVPEVTETVLHDGIGADCADTIVDIQQVSVDFKMGGGFFRKASILKAVKSVSLKIPRGSFYGLVGESGSGKTTLGRTILGATHISNGAVHFHSEQGISYDIAHMQRAQDRHYRSKSQMIFQDPYASLSPRMTIRDIIAEPLEVMAKNHPDAKRAGLPITRKQIDAQVVEIAEKCQIDIPHLKRFPHAFSGGQRQRIAIARALVCTPEFILADESTSALDVSIQAEILKLLKQLQQDLGLTVLFISHDLSVVANVCDTVAVMRQGQLVEVATPKSLFNTPKHPYTRNLIASIPSLQQVYL